MTDTFTFETATKAGAKARLALAGPTGSGKTYTALKIATAWGGTIGVIDTERGSASKYARNPATGNGLFAFQRLNMQRYDPRDLPGALAAAAAAGIDTIIIDSLSKFWSGAGGMLEQVDAAGKRSFGGNSFGGWKEASPWEAAMIEAMLSYPGHLIVTMRVKTEWVIAKNANGRNEPQKIGMQPVQRAGIEYEFDIVGDMDTENNLVVSKTRCPDIAGLVVNRPGAEFAQTILNWLDDGAPAKNALDYRADALDPAATYASLRTLYTTVQHAGLMGAAVPDQVGDSMTLGQLIISAGKAAEARETFGAEAQPDPTSPRQPATESPPSAPAADEAAAKPEPAEANGRAAGKAPQAPTEPPGVATEPPPATPAGKWVAAWRAKLAEADEDGLRVLQREVGSAVQKRTIASEMSGELSGEIRARRAELNSVPA